MNASILKKIFVPDSRKLSAHEVYIKLVNQARKPFFFQECGVSDTLDGRFDVIVLHLFLLTHRLKNNSPEFLRDIWEVFFSDMDRSLREMGASDTGIGKRIKKMAQAFYGRIDAYEKTLADEAAFRESIIRNLYREVAVDEEKISALIAYVIGNLECLQKQDIAAITSGDLRFCD